MIKKITWLTMAFFAVGVALYAWALAFVPELRSPLVNDIFLRTPLSAYGHFVGAGIALAIGAFQMNARIRKQYLANHRWLGRVYLFAVVIAALSAFRLSLDSFGGLVTHVAFALLGLCWISSTLMAYYCVRNHKLQQHEIWMIRSYALTLAAVTLRLYLPASMIAEIPFEVAYPVIAWIAWVPNILIAEWFILPTLLRPARNQTSIP
ncbi:MAG: DUF2306 domain-containing protein [Oceanicoccus sp.]